MVKIRFSVRTLLIAMTLVALISFSFSRNDGNVGFKELKKMGVQLCRITDLEISDSFVTVRNPKKSNKVEQATLDSEIVLVSFYKGFVIDQNVCSLVSRFEQLKYFHAASCRFEHSIVKSLVDLENLEELDVRRSNFGDSDLIQLSELKKLRVVLTANSEVTQQGVDRLRELRPDITVKTWVNW